MGKPKKSRIRKKRENSSKGAHAEKHTVMESMLKEREELLSLHEHKVIALKKEYEEKLEKLGKKESELSRRETLLKDASHQEAKIARHMQKLEAIERQAGSEVNSLKARIGALKKESESIEKEIADKKNRAKELHLRFGKAHSSFLSIEAQHREVLQQLSKDRELSEMKKKELGEVNREIAQAKKNLDSISSRLTHDIIREIKVLAMRIDDHLKHKDSFRAKQDYSKIREFYAKLSSKEKKRIYSRISKIVVSVS